MLYPTDSLGQICGQGELSSKPYLLFFDLTRCLNPAVLSLGCPTPQICVEKCPNSTTLFYQNPVESKQSLRQFCQPISNAIFNSKSKEDLVNDKLCPPWVLASTAVLGRCMPTFVDDVGADDNATVVPPDSNPNGDAIKKGTVKHALYRLGAFLNLRNFGERVFNDLSDTWWMIGLGFLLAFALSFIWILLMRCAAGVMVWCSIGLVFILAAGLFGYSLHKYLLVKDEAESQKSIVQVDWTPDYLQEVLELSDTWLAFTILLGILTGVIFLILVALRQRIQIAIRLLEESAKAVGTVCSAILWPLVPFLLHVVVVLWFVAVAMYLSSAGQRIYTINYDHESFGSLSRSLPAIETEPPPECYAGGNCRSPDDGQPYKRNDTCNPSVFNVTCSNCPQLSCQFTRYQKAEGGWLSNWMTWYNLFGFFWAMEFVTAFGEMVLAGVFARWYWTPRVQGKKDLPCCVLGASVCNTLTFHLGTVAFGSLIIAIIRFVRAIVQWIEDKLRAYNNDLTKCLLCLCKCCLWCLEKFMRFINRNAYIMCAMKSSNFCKSAKDSFNLLMRNIVRVVVLNNVVAFLLFLGKLVIVGGVGSLSFFVFSGHIPELQDDIPTLNYLFTPIVVIVVGTYFIASSFFSVYAMAVDTLFLCFLEDLERNDGSRQRPYFMSTGLQKTVGRMQKFREREDHHPSLALQTRRE